MGLNAQSAIEFIMTYSWAIIIISLFIITVILISDARPPSVYLGSSCNIQPLLPCTDALLTYNTVNPLQYYLVFTNQLGSVLHFPHNSLNISTSSMGGSVNYQYGNCQPAFASKGSSVLCTANIITPTKPAAGSQSALTFILSYNICSSSSQSSCTPSLYKSSGFSTETVSPSNIKLNSLTFLTVPSTATIILNGITYYNGISAYFLSGNYVLFSSPPNGYQTISWSVSSPSSVLSSTTTQNTVLTLSSDAVVTASYAQITTTSASTSTSTSTTSTTATTTIRYTYAGANTSTGPVSVTFDPGYTWYFCGAYLAAQTGTTTPSYTPDEQPTQGTQFITSIGHQSSNVCTVSNDGGGAYYGEIAGVGVNYPTYAIRSTGSSAQSQYTFNYGVADSGQYTFIIISEFYQMQSISLPSGCNQVENQIGSPHTLVLASRPIPHQGITSFTAVSPPQFDTYIAVCSGQNPDTYTVTVTPSYLGLTPAAWVVYSVG